MPIRHVCVATSAIYNSMDEGFSDGEVVLEDEVWEVEDSEDRPPEDDDGKNSFFSGLYAQLQMLYCIPVLVSSSCIC